MKKAKPTENQRVMAELLETAAELGAYGLVSKLDLARLKTLADAPPVYTADRVVSIRTQITKTSQAAFAALLNVSASTVQKWESPTADKRPGGAAAKLLQLVEAKGVEALLL